MTRNGKILRRAGKKSYGLIAKELPVYMVDKAGSSQLEQERQAGVDLSCGCGDRRSTGDLGAGTFPQGLREGINSAPQGNHSRAQRQHQNRAVAFGEGPQGGLPDCACGLSARKLIQVVP